MYTYIRMIVNVRNYTLTLKQWHGMIMMTCSAIFMVQLKCYIHGIITSLHSQMKTIWSCEWMMYSSIRGIIYGISRPRCDYIFTSCLILLLPFIAHVKLHKHKFQLFLLHFSVMGIKLGFYIINLLNAELGCMKYKYQLHFAKYIPTLIHFI